VGVGVCDGLGPGDALQALRLTIPDTATAIIAILIRCKVLFFILDSFYALCIFLIQYSFTAFLIRYLLLPVSTGVIDDVHLNLSSHCWLEWRVVIVYEFDIEMVDTHRHILEGI
jgi:hypothetical protein